jgi:MT0933-like antitoxin protein
MSGMFDSLKDAATEAIDKAEDFASSDQAKKLVADHGDQIDSAVDSATDKVDDLTGGKSDAITEKIDSAVDSATDSAAQ